MTRLSRYSVYKDLQHGGLHESEIDSLEAKAQTFQIENRDVGKSILSTGPGLGVPSSSFDEDGQVLWLAELLESYPRLRPETGECLIYIRALRPEFRCQ